jgi:hypothetical protein
MTHLRIVFQILCYKPEGRRPLESVLIRWQETVTGHQIGLTETHTHTKYNTIQYNTNRNMKYFGIVIISSCFVGCSLRNKKILSELYEGLREGVAVRAYESVVLIRGTVKFRNTFGLEDPSICNRISVFNRCLYVVKEQCRHTRIYTQTYGRVVKLCD